MRETFQIRSVGAAGRLTRVFDGARAASSFRSDLFIETTPPRNRQSSVGATQLAICPPAILDRKPTDAAPLELDGLYGALGSYKQDAPNGACRILAATAGRMKNARQAQVKRSETPLWLIGNRVVQMPSSFPPLQPKRRRRFALPAHSIIAAARVRRFGPPALTNPSLRGQAPRTGAGLFSKGIKANLT
jgi:hypothetical protein